MITKALRKLERKELPKKEEKRRRRGVPKEAVPF